MTSRSRLDYLMDRFFQHTGTEEERLELLQIIDKGQDDEAIRAWMDESRNQVAEKYRLGETQSDQILDAILGTEREPAASIPEKAYEHKQIWRRLAAAAVIILLVCTGAYFIFTNKQNPTELSWQERIKNDIAPGTNKAALKLSNGSTIILDTAHNGTIASQGNSKVIKTDSGKLSYLSPEPGSKVSEVIGYNTLSTPRGGQYQLVLPDGSKVWLNAASSITYPTAFTGKERAVIITGEAYFEIVHNARMPFLVRAGNEIIEDLGTAFNVNAYEDESMIRTTLLEGSIKLSANQQQSANLQPAMMLKPGEQAVINADGIFKKTDNTDIAEAIAWKNGYFQFGRASLQTLMRQIGRWYDVQISYEGNIRPMEFGGRISRNNNVSEVLKILELSKVHFKIEGKKIIVMP